MYIIYLFDIAFRKMPKRTLTQTQECEYTQRIGTERNRHREKKVLHGTDTDLGLGAHEIGADLGQCQSGCRACLGPEPKLV